MVISIEDYLARRRLARHADSTLLLAVGGTAAVPVADRKAGATAAQVLPLARAADYADCTLLSAVELGTVYAEATLV